MRTLDPTEEGRSELLGLLWTVSGDMLDFQNHIAIARQHVSFVRDVGALAQLAPALTQLAWSERLAGHLEAASSVDEAREMSAATGSFWPEWPGAHGIIRLGILCWQGHEQMALELSDEVINEAAERGQGLTGTIVNYGLTTLKLRFRPPPVRLKSTPRKFLKRTRCISVR